MTLLEHLRTLAAGLPPGASVTLSGDWLREQLAATAGPSVPAPADDQSIVQLAVRFGRAPSTVRAWLEAGRFPGAYKLRGRDWRVPPAGVASFLESERAVRPGGAPRVRPARGTANIGDWRKAG